MTTVARQVMAVKLIAVLSVLELLVLALSVDLPSTQPAHKNNVMAASVRVNKRLTGASSGVIIRAQKDDKNTKLWILSTGHMRDRYEPEIEIFYKDGKRLKEPIYVKGEICLLVENNTNKGIDFCVICAEVEGSSFAHVPLAPAKFTLKKGDKLLSVGCDLGIEPKCFEMKMKCYREGRGDFYIDGESKVGRSGGGIFTADGKYVVGVCWGGYADEPKSMFTNHKVISTLIEQSGVMGEPR